jgi:geranylgeranyl reductase family protein
MQHRTIYDVIVVGAGPAGSFLAYLLAAGGHLKVLLIDKKDFPRYKTCGGGLTRRALRLLPFDLAPVIEDRARTAVVSIDHRPVYRRSFAEPIIAMVMRDRFDAFLLDQARRAGSQWLPGVRFEDLVPQAGGLRVLTSAGRFDARVLIGADGVNSTAARALGLRIKRRRFYALEAEVAIRSTALLAQFRGSVHFDFGVIPGGYGWVFPKKNHLSVGVLTAARSDRGLKACFNAYLQKKIAADSGVTKLAGYSIPWGTGAKSVFAGCRGLLVGDAAGLTDPISGEGIYHALNQARMAAPVIEKFVRGSDPDLEGYDRHMQLAYRREMLHACGMNRFLYGCERLSHPILKRSGELLAEHFLNITIGRSTYRQLSAKLRQPKNIFRLLSGGRKPQQ